MMKKSILTFILVICAIVVVAQSSSESSNSRPANNINLNLFGDISLISLNYERLFFVRPSFALASKIGIGYDQEYCLGFFGGCGSIYNFFTIPHHLTGIIGKERRFFEFGLGGTMRVGKKRKYVNRYFLYPIIGMRFLPLNSNLIFRIFSQIPINGRADGISAIPGELIFRTDRIKLGISLGIPL